MWRLWLQYYILASLFSVTASTTPLVFDEATRVSYRGTITEASVEHFENIRFAHDTSGARRFAPPEPFLPPPDSIVDASIPGPACPQIKDAMPPFFSHVDEISEDCLNLHIARPAGLNLSSTSNLPVVIWLHGGGVVKGSAYDAHFDPDNVIRLSVADRQPIIYVALQYRLSIFGFASSKTLKRAKSLNVGMRDQRVGFQWVKDHIRAFGGDPERITAYGLSAGGTFISVQHFAYGGKKGLPFQQAYMMSGPPGTALNLTSDATTHHTTAVAEKVECIGTDDSKILSCLRDVPMQDLLKAAMEHSVANCPPSGLFTFIPSIDDDFLPERPSKLLRQGKFVKGIRSILAWTQDDGAINAGPASLTNSEEDMVSPIKKFAHALSDDQLSKLFSLYPPSDFEEDVQNYEARKSSKDPVVSVHYFRLSRILRDLLFTCSSVDFSYHMVKQTQRSLQSNFTGARLYDLNQSVLAPLWDAAGMPYVGVSHGSDTNYIFNGVFPEGKLNGLDKNLSERFTRSLINFAHTGNPHSDSKKKSFDWPEAYGDVSNSTADLMPSDFNLLVIGGPYGTRAVRSSRSANEDSTESLQNEGARHQYASQFDNYFGLGKLQKAIGNILDFGNMEDSASTQLGRKIQQEKLFERCSYINSLAETLGV